MSPYSTNTAIYALQMTFRLAIEIVYAFHPSLFVLTKSVFLQTNHLGGKVCTSLLALCNQPSSLLDKACQSSTGC
jgi:hypothetical protein